MPDGMQRPALQQNYFAPSGAGVAGAGAAVVGAAGEVGAGAAAGAEVALSSAFFSHATIPNKAGATRTAVSSTTFFIEFSQSF